MMAARDPVEAMTPWYRRAPAAYEAAEPRATVERKLRVLVVDDNTDAAAALSLLVECWGYDVRLAYDGDQAVRVAAGYCPDAVLLDIGLPGMSGYDVASKLRAGEAQTRATCAHPSAERAPAAPEPSAQPQSHLPEALSDDLTPPHALLVAVTGYGMPEDVARAKAAGFDHHVVKPSDPALIESLLARYASHLGDTPSRFDRSDREGESASDDHLAERRLGLSAVC